MFMYGKKLGAKILFSQKNTTKFNSEILLFL